MAITRVGHQLGTGTSGNASLTAIPATGGGTLTVLDGDYVVVVTARIGGAGSTLTVNSSGWDVIGPALFANDTDDTHFAVFAKRMESVPDTTVSWTWSSWTRGCHAIIVYRGVDATNPLDVAVVGTTGTNSTLIDPGSITPVTSGAVILVGGATVGNTDTLPIEITTIPAEYDWTDKINAAGGTGRHAALGVADKAWSSGPFDGSAWTCNESLGSSGWCAYAIALRPATTSGNTLAADGGSLAVAGGAANLLAARKITADGASLAVSGGDANLTRGLRLEAAGASLTVTGGDAAFIVSRKLAADGASLTAAGGNTTLTVQTAGAYTLAADGAALSLTPGAAGLVAARRLAADGRALTVTGGNAALRVSRVLVADGAPITITGGAATLSVQTVGAYTLTADGAAISLAPGEAVLIVQRRLEAAPTDLTVTGSDAAFRLDRVLQADGALIAITGGSANLIRVGPDGPPDIAIPATWPDHRIAATWPAGAIPAVWPAPVAIAATWREA